MDIDVRVPSPGESVREGLLAQWNRRDGERVRKGEALFVIETDKITFEVPAESDGILRVLVPEGETVAVGSVVARIEAGEGEAAPPEPERKEEPKAQPPSEPAAPPPSPPKREEQPRPAPPPPPRAEEPPAGPAVRRLLAENRLEPSSVRATGPGGRLTKGDVLLHLESREKARAPEAPGPARAEAGEKPAGDRAVTRKPLSPIRRRIAERLLEAQRNTATLTTFNDVDMSRVQAIRGELREAFRQKHGVSLGLTSFFVRAAVEALLEFPQVNAFIEGDEMVFHSYCDVGIAVGSERGLVVPVLRDAERLSFADIERAVADFVTRIRENRLAVADLEGGTFTITNGGVFGSLLSTPILNPPQSAILGLHRIEDRPVAVDGQVVVRPMMYVALSYDHRIIDGREAVTFLKRIKELVESPERLLVEA